MNISQIATKVAKLATDNSPLILTAIGVTGALTTALLAGKASYKAAFIIIGEEEQKAFDEGTEVGRLTTKEKVKLVWHLYIPPAASITVTIAAIVMANRIGTRRAAAMAAAYSLSEKAFEEYREKIVEKIGENKERSARDELAQDRVNRNPITNHEVIVTGNGSVPCYDMFSGRYFISDMETIKKAQNDTNYRIIHDGYSSLNDFYNRLGLDNSQMGEEVGWTNEDVLEIHFSTTMTNDQKPCISIEFRTKPVRNYFRLH